MLTTDLLTWYDHHKRDLPWRTCPDSYAIFVSEFMLQQTRMDTVLPYFNRFMEAVPSLEALAALPEDQLMKLWEGLGYYRRARHLQQAARQVLAEHQGIIPADPAELLRLQGIGEYTAGAIASTAYQVKVPAMDGNVIRILSRLYCLDEDAKKTKGKLAYQERLLSLLPEERPGDFNQALMDLGSMVCTPKNPLCPDCPLGRECCAFHSGRQAYFPQKTDKKTVPIHHKTVLLIMHEAKIALVRKEEGLLSGLYHYPLLDGIVTHAEISALYPGAEVIALGPSRHVFSHQVWQMEGYLVRINTPDTRFTWYDRSQFEQLALPSTYKKYQPPWPR